MKQKSWLALVFAVLSFMAWAGLSATDVFEYAAVGQRRATAAVKDAIPLSVEIDRLEVVLGKLDQQLSQQKLQVAKAQVALENADAALAGDRDGAEHGLMELKTLRNLLGTGCQPVKVGCYSVSPTELRQALAAKLAAYEGKQSSITTREQAIARQRQAYQVLANRYAEWNQQRSLLAHRLEALRAQNAAQVASSDGAGVFDTTELARATQLADDIEQRLRVFEKQQALGTDPLAGLLNPSKADSDVECRVDRVLAGQTTAASR